ncbi:MAG: sulfotransferase family 2 domain-containing protein [Chitinophagaceae bacterium]
MICHEFKCVFIHIPKAAGQSVEHFFLRKLNLDWQSRAPLLLRPNDQPQVGPPKLAHLKAIDYVKHHYLSQELFDRYFKFSFVRNPWSRAVSFYKFLGYNSVMSFESFTCTQLPVLLKKRNYFLMPQYDFLYHQEKLVVNFVGKFENINNDFKIVCEQLGFQDADLPHINKSEKEKFKGLKMLAKEPKLLKNLSLNNSNKKDFKSYYTNKSKDIIFNIYKDDVKAFNYEF